MEKFAVVVPVYNEEYNVLKLASELEAKDIPFIMVDDGSTDKTATSLWMQDIPAMIYFPNRGKSYAIQLGAKMLRKEGYQWILVCDADGQHSIDDIEKFDTALLFNENEVDIIIGNRMWDKHSMPKIRRITNKIMSWIVSKLARQNIPDSQCGFRLIRASIFDQIDMKCEGFDGESELLIKASRKGCKILSIPIKSIYYKKRRSKIRPLRDTIKFVKMLISCSI